MNRSRLLLIGTIALALGIFVSLLVYRNLQARAASANTLGDEVAVAANDLQIGSKVEDRDIRMVRFPTGSIPANCFHQKSKVIGRGVIVPMSRGEFILPDKLASENVFGLPSLIPSGMRAVSVRVNDTTSVSGFVTPGTRVDVLLTGNPQGSSEQQTTTVLENVAVLAAGTKLERNSAGEALSAPVITLLVSPDDAQKLALATTQGHIQLTLRNPLDTKQEELDAMRLSKLYKNGGPPPAAPAHPKPVKHVETAPPASPYTVEVYKGAKKEEEKFQETE